MKGMPHIKEVVNMDKVEEDLRKKLNSSLKSQDRLVISSPKKSFGLFLGVMNLVKEECWKSKLDSLQVHEFT